MSDVIKEFLVQLGYKVDEASLAKFTKSVERTTKEVVGLGAEVVATSLAIQVGVSKMARDFEQLYFASARTHSSVTALQSFEYAARTIGISSDQAKGAVEGLADAMRSNPGVGALLNRFGVQTAGRGSVEILDDFVEKLGKMPFYIAQQYATIAGIDGKTLYQLLQRHAELKRAEEDRKKRVQAAGVDEQKLAKDSHDYNNELRHLEDNLGILGEQITAKFLPVLKWITHLVDGLVTGFTGLNKATEGWAGVLSTIATSSLGAYIAKLILMRTLFRGIATEASAAGAATAAAAGGGAAAGGIMSRVKGAVGRAIVGRGGGVMGLALETMLLIKSDKANGNKVRDWLRGQLGIVDPDETSGDKGALRMKAGAGTLSDQMAAIALGVQSEINGFNRVTAGNDDYHKGRRSAHNQDRAFDFTINDPSKSSEVAERVRAMLSRMNINGTVLDEYKNPSLGATGGHIHVQNNGPLTGQAGGSGGAVINQKTDIHVSGSDARDAASKTAAAQDRVNGDIVRNVGAVTR